MNDLHYALIRFIPDMARMEPMNFGVVLQGAGKIDFKLNPNFARKKEVETPVFQKWRDFFVYARGTDDFGIAAFDQHGTFCVTRVLPRDTNVAQLIGESSAWT